MDIRWDTPFCRSLSFRLFMQHFTELNQMYWSQVPVANKIEKDVKTFQNTGEHVPLDFFIVHDEDDRRIAPTFDEWKISYRAFQNFVRLNSLLSLSSCFEVYLRSITSLAIESKPGVIFGVPDAIDGTSFLKVRREYFTFNEKTYPFYRQVDSICRGEWQNHRVPSYSNIFGATPEKLENNKRDLDDLRTLRNNIAHYFSRDKRNYESPVTFHSDPMMRISHDRLIRYFGLVHETVEAIDNHLYHNFIGSYELLKYYLIQKPNSLATQPLGVKAKWLQKNVGSNGGKPVGSAYYKELFRYFESL